MFCNIDKQNYQNNIDFYMVGYIGNIINGNVTNSTVMSHTTPSECVII